MKKILMATVALLSINSFASQIECFDQRTGKSVLFIADDYGSITTGGMTVDKKVYRFNDEKGYSYYYGEYLSINQMINGKNVVVTAVSKSDGKFIGRIDILKDNLSEKLVNIVCNE